MSGNIFDLKCHKCGVWYAASCHWYTMYDKVRYQRRDAEMEPIGPLAVAEMPRIMIENVTPHECKKGGARYGV